MNKKQKICCTEKLKKKKKYNAEAAVLAIIYESTENVQLVFGWYQLITFGHDRNLYNNFFFFLFHIFAMHERHNHTIQRSIR